MEDGEALRGEVTGLLRSAEAAGEDPLERLWPLLYDDLRAIARRQLRRERPGQTLVTTALVHEAYLKLVDSTAVARRGRAYFFAAAARAMRQVLVDHARRRGRLKRQGPEDVTALARYLRMTADALGRDDVDLGASRALRQAIGQRELDPGRGPTPDTPREAESVTELPRIPPPQRTIEAQARDLAERSPVQVSTPVSTGDVLAFDPARVGSLRPADKLADPAVAGIALEPSRPGTNGGAETRLAEGGLVHCRVDAGYGAIRAGDLLTSSPTPGHAMRALEALPGTVIAKAAEPLDAGTGLIRVLVWPR